MYTVRQGRLEIIWREIAPYAETYRDELIALESHGSSRDDACLSREGARRLGPGFSTTYVRARLTGGGPGCPEPFAPGQEGADLRHRAAHGHQFPLKGAVVVVGVEGKIPSIQSCHTAVRMPRKADREEEEEEDSTQKGKPAALLTENAAFQ